MKAVKRGDDYRVIDTAGGVWFPDEDAQAEIRKHPNPPAKAVKICRDTPTRGVWCD